RLDLNTIRRVAEAKNALHYVTLDIRPPGLKFLSSNYATLTLFFPQILPEANGLDCARFVITVTHRFSSHPLSWTFYARLSHSPAFAFCFYSNPQLLYTEKSNA